MNVLRRESFRKQVLFIIHVTCIHNIHNTCDYNIAKRLCIYLDECFMQKKTVPGTMNRSIV